jgi:hypothetical protein
MELAAPSSSFQLLPAHRAGSSFQLMELVEISMEISMVKIGNARAAPLW